MSQFFYSYIYLMYYIKLMIYNQQVNMKILTFSPFTLTYLLILSIFFSTTAMAQQYLYYIFTPKCYNSLVESFNITDTQCLKITFSKLMGYMLVAGGAIIKFPQIIKILVSKSVYGISFTSLLAECMTNWVTIVYSWYRGTPFSIYGENAFLLAQNLLILTLFILYGRNVPKGVKDPGQKTINRCITLFAIFIVILFVTKNPDNWPKTVISYSMVLQISLFAFARLSQIFHILRCKSTGNLALLTCLLMVIGNLGRMFTIFVQIKGDYMFAISIVLAFVLNGTILTLFFVYWNNTKKENQKIKKQK